MKKNIFTVAIIGLLLTLVGCKTSPILNISDTPIEISSKHSSKDVKKIILKSGAALNWKMKSLKEGHIVATLYIRNHVAVVDIEFTKNSYSINYKSGQNLKYDGVNIHKNYNRWIQNLNQLIQRNLSEI